MLRVTTVDGNRHDVDASAWHVDENDGLHLKDDRRNAVATFAAGKWIAVQKTTPAAR